MVDDWSVTQERHDLPAEVWDYLKAQGFLGMMIIPKEYGGLAFSAYAHSEIVTKLSTRSSALAVSVMVPNSLGPAELLLHYGTQEQKGHYLPRLARGEEVPAFALTSPWAGSDAAAIPDSGIVCKGEWQGREVIGMKVTWDKRYITLAPVCTLLGLAFRMYDPDGLIGDTKDIGITLGLLPRDTDGVEIGRRHFPLNSTFQNGPIRGKDVFIPLEFIIGGPAMATGGAGMLMECLAVGRSISLPLCPTPACQADGPRRRRLRPRAQPVPHRRRQVRGRPGALARIGSTYMMDAARTMTAGAVDLGEKPSVVSAIVKYHVTERARQVVNDGMDVIGGKGICLGPSNFLGRAYQQIPIGITVEGANILTRSLIIFGQGAIRCHPYVLAEMRAAQSPDRRQGLDDFDRAFWGHAAFVARNALRAAGTALTGARHVGVHADVAPDMKRYYQLLSRYSAAFALLADTAMLVLGGSLKRRERLSARLGDILSQMYLISATLKRFEDEGRQAADAPLAHWSIQDALFKLQQAFDGVLDNLPNRALAWVLARLVFPWGRPQGQPSDQLGQDVARLLIQPGAARDRLTAGCHLPATDAEPVGAIEQALAATLDAEPIEAKIRELEKRGALEGNPQANVRDIADAAFAIGGITAEEYAVVKRRNRLRDTVVKVDDFAFDFGAQDRSIPRPNARSPEGGSRMAFKPVYVGRRLRTPFLKARTGPGPFSAGDLAVQAGRALLLRQPFAPTDFDEVIVGCAAPLPDEAEHRPRDRAAAGLRQQRAGLDRDA